jgi:hypothetical protein
MYKIIGSDQKEYGPISADQMRQWIAEGRVNAQTQVLPEGAAAWQALGAVPEFAAAFTPAPFAASPQSTAGPADDGFAAAKKKVLLPAIGLFITAGLDLIAGVWDLIQAAFSKAGGLAAMNQTQIENMPPQSQHMMMQMMSIMGSLILVFGFVNLLFAAVLGFGGFKMLRLKGFGLCIPASIIALIPITTPCCCGGLIGIPTGIIALIFINSANVKPYFS